MRTAPVELLCVLCVALKTRHKPQSQEMSFFFFTLDHICSIGCTGRWPRKVSAGLLSYVTKNSYCSVQCCLCLRNKVYWLWWYFWYPAICFQQQLTYFRINPWLLWIWPAFQKLCRPFLLMSESVSRSWGLSLFNIWPRHFCEGG